MAKPTFFEPVKTSPETLGLATRVFPIGARVGEVAEGTRGEARLPEDLEELQPRSGRIGGRLEDYGLSREERARGIPAARARGKLKGAMTPKTP